MTEDYLYKKIWDWIHYLKDKYKHDGTVKIKANLISFTDFFIEEDTYIISLYLKKLVASGQVKTNLFDENVYPTDAYILPTNFE